MPQMKNTQKLMLKKKRKQPIVSAHGKIDTKKQASTKDLQHYKNIYIYI